MNSKLVNFHQIELDFFTEMPVIVTWEKQRIPTFRPEREDEMVINRAQLDILCNLAGVKSIRPALNVVVG